MWVSVCVYVHLISKLSSEFGNPERFKVCFTGEVERRQRCERCKLPHLPSAVSVNKSDLSECTTQADLED